MSFSPDSTSAAVDHDAAAIVTTIIAMGHSLRLDVVAEGVESEAQLDFLRRHDCDYVQGHLFGDPVDAAAFARLLLADMEDSGTHRALFEPAGASDDLFGA